MERRSECTGKSGIMLMLVAETKIDPSASLAQIRPWRCFCSCDRIALVVGFGADRQVEAVLPKLAALVRIAHIFLPVLFGTLVDCKSRQIR